MHSIAVAGHVCLDLKPVLGRAAAGAPGQLVEVGPLTVSPGGSVANTGLVLSDLGAAVTAYATVGTDELGRLLVAALRDRGLDLSSLTSTRGTTSYSLVIERDGSDRVIWHHTGTNALFDGTHVDPGSADVLHLGYPTLLPALVAGDGASLARLLARARAAGAVTSVDLAVVDPTSPAAAVDWDTVLTAMCAHTDVLSPSLTDLTSALRIDEGFSASLVDDLASRLLEAGVAVVAISCGQHGLFVRTAGTARFRESGQALAGVAQWADRSLVVPAVAVREVVTTNGAGDAASAGLLFAMAAGAGLEEAGMLSVASSAAVIGGRRAEPETVVALQPGLTDLMRNAR